MCTFWIMKITTRSTRALLRGTPALLIGYSVLAMATGLTVAKETPIYKSIAADGSTVFTDQPAPDATVVKPAPLNVMDALATPPANTTIVTPRNAEEPTTASIDTVTINQPLDDETFTDQEAPIRVEFTTLPATASLPTGMTANLRLDDKLVVTGSSYRMSVDIPERGTHHLQLQLVDQTGAIVVESAIIQIHVKQHVAGNVN